MHRSLAKKEIVQVISRKYLLELLYSLKEKVRQNNGGIATSQYLMELLYSLMKKVWPNSGGIATRQYLMELLYS